MLLPLNALLFYERAFTVSAEDMSIKIITEDSYIMIRSVFTLVMVIISKTLKNLFKNMQPFILHNKLILKSEIRTNLFSYRRPSMLEKENMIKRINPSNFIASERRSLT